MTKMDGEKGAFKPHCKAICKVLDQKEEIESIFNLLYLKCSKFLSDKKDGTLRLV